MADEYLTGKQPAFVVAFVDNELAGGQLTLHEVAVKAGYAPKSAGVTASQLLSDPKIIQAIADRKRLLAEGVLSEFSVDAKRVISEWAQIALADGSQITQVRRLNCRHCWGFRFHYQYTDAEYAKESAQEFEDAAFEKRNTELDRFCGGGGFRKTRDPNPDCPECAGEGIEDVYIADFRKLPPALRKLIVGVKQTRNGLEVITRDQDGALRNLAQYLGLLVNKNEHSGPGGGPIQSQNANVNYTLPADPVEAARQYQLLMEGKR